MKNIRIITAKILTDDPNGVEVEFLDPIQVEPRARSVIGFTLYSLDVTTVDGAEVSLPIGRKEFIRLTKEISGQA